MKTVVEKLFENADLHPDKLAVVFENEEVTYGQLKDAVVRLTSWFKLHGVQAGDRVIVQAAYCKWFVAACYAAHLCGAIFVPVEKNVSETALEDSLGRMRAKAVISKLPPKDVPSLNYSSMDTELADIEIQPWVFPDLESVGNIMLTSGTTGAPKGVMITQKNLAASCANRIRDMYIPKDDIGLTYMPLDHVGSMRMWHTALYNGSTYILQDGLMDLRQFYAFIGKYSVRSMYLSPSAVAILEQLSQDKLHEYADQIDYVHVGASLLQKPQRDYLKRMLPKSRLYNVLGSTETASVSLYRFDEVEKDVNCVGKPFQGVKVRILDENLQELPVGEHGRMAFRSDMNCKGYWERPELTEKAYYDGFFITNDGGYIGTDGYLYLLGRVDDMINIGGLKVYPSEIENAALEIDGIEECLCVDMPHSITGSAARLLVRTKEHGGVLSPRSIRAALAEKLDNYKVPARIELVEEIKKNGRGKPDRKYYRSG